MRGKGREERITAIWRECVGGCAGQPEENSRVGRPRGVGIAIKAICCIVPAIRRRQLSPTVLTSSQGLSAALEHVRFIDLSLFVPRRTSPTKTTLLHTKPRARFRCVTPAANPGSSCTRQLRLVDLARFSLHRQMPREDYPSWRIKFNFAFTSRRDSSDSI